MSDIYKMFSKDYKIAIGSTLLNSTKTTKGFNMNQGFHVIDHTFSRIGPLIESALRRRVDEERRSKNL